MSPLRPVFIGSKPQISVSHGHKSNVFTATFTRSEKMQTLWAKKKKNGFVEYENLATVSYQTFSLYNTLLTVQMFTAYANIVSR